MDELSSEIAEAINQSDLASIAKDNNDVDHDRIIEEFNSFAQNIPEIIHSVSEHLQHGFGRCNLYTQLHQPLVCLRCCRSGQTGRYGLSSVPASESS